MTTSHSELSLEAALFSQGWCAAINGEALEAGRDEAYAAGHAKGVIDLEAVIADAPASVERLQAMFRPVEELTPEGVQLVIPGAERKLPPQVKQGELW